MLRGWDQRQAIRFTNIAEPDFVAAEVGVDYSTLMAEIHGRLPDGSWIRGVEVFRRLYAATGWRWLVAISRWPGISSLLNWGYHLFARNRLRWTGRCDPTCRVETKA